MPRTSKNNLSGKIKFDKILMLWVLKHSVNIGF
jgi:hypothetical protein